MHGAAFGAGIYVAVGDGGTISSSTDTITWVPRFSGTTNPLKAVQYGTSGFVAVGQGVSGATSTILNSTDGLHWVASLSPVTNALNAVCHLSGRYVAVGSAGIIVTSTNGLDWASVKTGAPYSLNGVAAATIYMGAPVYSNENFFVAVGDSGTILTSPDGLAWTARFSGIFARLTAVSILPVAQKPVFVAAGESGTIATSSDSTIWTAQSSGTSSDLYAVANDNGQSFGAVGAGGVFVAAANGIGWTQQPSGTTNDLRGLVFANGNFLAVGNAGTIQAGMAWLPRNSGTSQIMSGVCYGNGTFVGVGAAGAIVTSTNGRDWVSRDSGSTNDLMGVCYGSNNFVAVGEGTILTSADGSLWTKQSTGQTNILLSVTYGNGSFVALGSYWLMGAPGPPYQMMSLRSTDAVNWSGPYLLPWFLGPRVGAVAFGNNVFAAIGYSELASSSDGASWTNRNGGVSYELSGPAFGNGTFVVIDQYGHVTTSPDGINWTPGTLGPFGTLGYGDYGFVVLGGFIGGPHVTALSTSQDGTTWISHHPIESYPGSVTFGQGTYVFLSDPGLIRQSTPVQASAQAWLGGVLSSNGFQISVTAQPGYSYTLQSSPTLVSPVWTTVHTFTATQAVTSFLDSTATNRSMSFYRITSP